MKKFIIKNRRNFYCSLLSMLTVLPYILLYNGPKLLFLGGLLALLLVQVFFNTASFIVEDDTNAKKDREKNIVRMMSRTVFIANRYGGGSVPPTQNIYTSDATRATAFSWLIVILVHLIAATAIEDQLAYAGPMQFGKYLPVWGIVLVLLVWDCVKQFMADVRMTDK
ncbi:MAG: hypothetical protein IKU27_08850 [Clostridia bacterium]|nr:hypothetical protein [Clostridia bacterium]